MHRLKVVFAAPVLAGMLAAAAGCAGVAAAAPPTAAPSATAPTGATPSTGAPSGGPSASPTAPFPGIWDITSWPQYRAAQAAVEQGHQPWLLDPEMVVQAWAARWAPNLPVRKVAADTYQVTEPGTHVLYTVRGTRPDPTGPAPIWVITQITHS
jgi:hypothetical protein